VTASPEHVDAIADARAALTPTQIAAKTTALNTRTDSRITSWATLDDQVAALDSDIATWTTRKSTADGAITTAQTQATAKAANIATLTSQVAALQTQVAAGGPPATAADVAERDEVVALKAELGIA
jgi:hypothetical protein